MRIGDSRLSADTQVCMDGQTAIKQFCKTEYMKGRSWTAIQKDLKKLIKSFVDEITHPPLKQQVAKSLYGLARRLWNIMENSASFGDLAVLMAIIGLKNKTAKTTAERKKFEQIVSKLPELPTKPKPPKQPWEEWFMRRKVVYGTDVQNKVRHYWKDVEATLRKMAKERAIDEEDARAVKERNSLRASAEIQVRQAGHEREIADLKANGHNLVICSSHADCSERCEKWQGRVYSLDGSYGTTDDGREFVPLEVATDVYYTTKAGRTYKNGLLGFNCRHRLVAYEKGKKPTHYTEKQVAKERAIDQKQREYERHIIRAREEMIMAKDVDKKQYKYWKAQEHKLMAEYREYSHANGRHYYISRIRIY